MKDADTSFKASEEIRAACLCFRARRTARIITLFYNEALRPLDIQAPQLTLLAAIAAAGPDGQRAPVLVDQLAIDPTTVSRNMKQLEKAGLARIARASSDGRVRVFTLTDKGRDTLTDALPLWRKAHNDVLKRLGAETASHLKEALDTATGLIGP